MRCSIFLSLSLVSLMAAVSGCQQSTAPTYQVFSNAEYAGNVSSLYAVGGSADPSVPTDFKWRDSTGTVHALSELKGHIILLNFWATTCSNCANEDPFLEKIAEDTSTPVTVIGISTDYDGHSFATVHDYVNTHDLRYQVVVDSSMSLYVNYFAAAGGQSALPETYVIGRDFTIKALLMGAQSMESFQAWIAKAN